MAIERLQKMIRRMKNPLVVDMSILPDHIPSQIVEQAKSYPEACKQFCTELLGGLKETVPAVRFNFSLFALLGAEGLNVLSDLLRLAGRLGYYVFLEIGEMLNPQNAAFSAQILLSGDSKWHFDGLILTAYSGSDNMKPYVSVLENTDKDLFFVARTSNKSASELQDLLSGTRLMHVAATEVVNRYAPSFISKCGYSRVGIVAAASAPDSLRTLRSKFKHTFMLLDGSDYPNANAKYCSYAFDDLGHGAVACAGTYITAAWQTENEDEGYVDCAIRAAERMKKNISRYITIL